MKKIKTVKWNNLEQWIETNKNSGMKQIRTVE